MSKNFVWRQASVIVPKRVGNNPLVPVPFSQGGDWIAFDRCGGVLQISFDGGPVLMLPTPITICQPWTHFELTNLDSNNNALVNMMFGTGPQPIEFPPSRDRPSTVTAWDTEDIAANASQSFALLGGPSLDTPLPLSEAIFTCVTGTVSLASDWGASSGPGTGIILTDGQTLSLQSVTKPVLVTEIAGGHARVNFVARYPAELLFLKFS